jgi:hypothetical protein
MKPKKSWREKLADSKGLPKVAHVCGKLTQRWGEGTFVIPAPREVDALMKRVPKGRLATITRHHQRAARRACREAQDPFHLPHHHRDFLVDCRACRCRG